MLIKERPLVREQDAQLLIGRDKDLATLAKSCQAGLNTLVVGKPGSGKTSLLAQTMTRLANKRVHRVAFVSAPLSSSGPELAKAIASEVVGPAGRWVDPLSRAMPTMRTFERTLSPHDQMMAEIDRLGGVDRSSVGGDEDGHWYDPGADIVVFVDGPSAKAATEFFVGMRDQLARHGYQFVVAVDTEAGTKITNADGARFFDGHHQLANFTPEVAARVIISRLDDQAPPIDQLREVLCEDGYTARAVVTLARTVFTQGVAALAGTSDSEAKRAVAWDQVVSIGRQAATLAKELQARGPTSASDEDLLATLGWSRSRVSEIFSVLHKGGWVEYTTEQGEHGGRPRKLYQLAEHLR